MPSLHNLWYLLKNGRVVLPQKMCVDNTQGCFFVISDGTPSDEGYAKGGLCQDYTNGKLYVNEGTKTTASWQLVDANTGTAGIVSASSAVVVDADKDIGDFRNLDAVNFDAGASGTAGTVDIFPTTASKGKFILSCDDQDGATNVTFKPAAMGQASVISIPDPGAATANVVLTDQANDGAPVTASSAELNVLDGVTAGTVLASGAVVVDGSKDISAFNNVGLVNLDAGSDAVAGTVDIFPATTAKGKFILSCVDQDGATNVTLTPAAMGQASVISIPDPGAATANVMLTDQANDGAPITASSVEINVLDGVTAGTVLASGAVVVDGSKNIGDFNNLDAVNFDAGSSGAAGTVDIFPTTGSKGKFTLTCTDQDADTAVELKPAAMGQATVISIPDPGAATANVLLTDQANDGAPVTASSAELNQLDGAILADMTAGAGFAETGTVCEHQVRKIGGMFVTEILLDLTGLTISAQAGDIIGDEGDAECHFGQITAAVNGTIVGGRVTCLETPADGDTDIDFYSGDEGTGTKSTEDEAATNLSNAAQLIDHGAWTEGDVAVLTALPGADQYLYAVGQAGGDNEYSGGIFLLELYGK